MVKRQGWLLVALAPKEPLSSRAQRTTSGKKTRVASRCSRSKRSLVIPSAARDQALLPSHPFTSRPKGGILYFAENGLSLFGASLSNTRFLPSVGIPIVDVLWLPCPSSVGVTSFLRRYSTEKNRGSSLPSFHKILCHPDEGGIGRFYSFCHLHPDRREGSHTLPQQGVIFQLTPFALIIV